MPRDPARIDRLLSVLETYWRQYPDLRLAQIVGNFTSGDPYYLEDEDLLAALERAVQPERPLPGQITIG